MSDEIDLECINLCATEDAFEKFQAVSMYEEEEYITLSDLVPPPPQPPGGASFTDELNKIESEMSSVIEQSQNVNSGSEIPESAIKSIEIGEQDIPMCETDSIQAMDDAQLLEILQEPIQRPDVQKKVSKKKRERATSTRRSLSQSKDNEVNSNATDINLETIDVIASSPVETHTKSSSDLDSSDIKQSDIDDLTMENNSTLHTEMPLSEVSAIDQHSDTDARLSAKPVRKRGRPRVRPEPNDRDKVQRKRGRPKKQASEMNLSQESENISIPTNPTMSVPDETVEKIDTDSTPKLVRRGRKKKVLLTHEIDHSDVKSPVQNVIDDDTEDLPLVNISKKKTENLLDTHTADKQETNVIMETESKPESECDIKSGDMQNGISVPQKTPKKRGRPRKSIQTPLIDNNKIENDVNSAVEDGDEIALSKLKQTIDNNDVIKEKLDLATSEDGQIDINNAGKSEESKVDENSSRRLSKMPLMSDFEYNIDSIVKENKSEANEELQENESLLIEDPNKRPVRRKVKQTLHYDEGSDEDPFAHVELSDDEPHYRKKGKRYYSDDEYIPSNNKRVQELSEISESSDSEFETSLSEVKKSKKKKGRKSDCTTPVKSPKKKGKLCDSENIQTQDVSTTAPGIKDENDIEVCIEPAVIKPGENSSNSQGWGASNEFENFLAKKIHGTDLQIKKVSSSKQSQSSLAPLEIPVVELKEPKMVEMCAQTNIIQTKSVLVQTTAPYDLNMKTNVALTKEQSESACEFLKSIVKTTSELGSLMTQKSEDFITKKINTTHVVDTFKMDYCVKKSFLLFKLAKHNLMQMEEDLTKQYELFLKSNNLLQHREDQKSLTGNVKAESDSDCEIVEAPVETQSNQKPGKAKPAFNPKTVFLNKELSIKIAKKPTDEPSSKKKLNIKGRHAVWINDSVMVKKVKPTQSFLAQDSRNKKPPDTYVTLEMVNNFFRNYYRQRALALCAPYITTNWIKTCSRKVSCNYFVIKSNDVESSPHTSSAVLTANIEHNTALLPNGIHNDIVKLSNITITFSPKSLFSMCTQVLHTNIYSNSNVKSGSMDSHTSIDSKHIDSHNSCSIVENIEIITQTTSKCDEMVVPSLRTLCYKCILKNMSFNHSSENKMMEIYVSPVLSNIELPDSLDDIQNVIMEKSLLEMEEDETNTIQSLFSLCAAFIQRRLSFQDTGNVELVTNEPHTLITYEPFTLEAYEPLTSETYEPPILKTYEPHTLKTIAFHIIKQCMYKNTHHQKVRSLAKICFDAVIIKQCMYKNTHHQKVRSLADICFDAVIKYTYCNQHDDMEKTLALTINSINTVSDEIFQNIECVDESSLYLEDENTNYSNDDLYEPFDNEVQHEEENWVSRVEMKELRSCITNVDTDAASSENDDLNPLEIGDLNPEANENDTAQIKIEPLDEASEMIADPVNIKSELVDHFEENPFANVNIVTKEEQDSSFNHNRVLVSNNSTYDVDMFEQFVQTNKMIYALNCDTLEDSQEIYSQSTLRIRRQYEPDSDNEFDTDMGLLVPQNIESVKDRLMESSEDEEGGKKNTLRKKYDKRKGKTKNLKQNKEIPTSKEMLSSKVGLLSKELPPPKEPPSSKEPPKEAPLSKELPPLKVILPSKDKPKNEIAVLTRRMREKIRQEEEKESSDSDTETVSLSVRRERNKKLDSKTKDPEEESTKECEIQCNDVDSTDQVAENNTGTVSKKSNNSIKIRKDLKCAKNEEDKKDLKSIKEDEDKYGSFPPVISADEPVELLECAPNLALFDKIDAAPVSPEAEPCYDANNESQTFEKEHDATETWKCYPIDGSDTKIYQEVQVALEKLPESFIETYFEYMNMTDRNDDDTEVERLTNLQSLSRTQTKDNKVRSKTKDKISDDQSKIASGDDISRPASPDNDDHYQELSPSEDEANVDDEEAPAVTRNNAENNLAKNLLMNDNDSDGENASLSKVKIKKEKDADVVQNDDAVQKYDAVQKHDTHVQDEKRDAKKNGTLVLTADKMMNKELALLHAPVVLDDDKTKEIVLKKSPRLIAKSVSKGNTSSDKIKDEENSSSDEQKKWDSTKEKKLKRMDKRQEIAIVDDAKRAKLVSEFLERRGGSDSRHLPRGRARRTSKKLLERQKQMRVLQTMLANNDLDGMTPGKKSSQAYSKGRRNIRKVIDKKSLARSTVIANMEESARKQRLIWRQAKLREILGVEEDVNVLVINDEVCLEYDFEEQRPAVTVHPFFTKVMKAHQYEGVKFMWDACFESVACVQQPLSGGGCILAHCMGLGKTLQVLALLHTVLTHPDLGMQRVLVCCPLSTVLNWVDEIHKWIGPVTDQIKVFELSKLKKTFERAFQLEDWYRGGGIFIIGYELFRSLTTLDPLIDDVRQTTVNKIRTALLDPGPDIIICDEGHLLKNDTSVLAQAMNLVATKRRIVLTGTPMQNNLREYYCMVKFVKPNLLGTYPEYANRFENPIMNGQHRDSSEEDIKLMKARTHILHKVLEGCLQRQEASVLYPYLPKKHEYTVFIPLTKCQWDLYKHYMAYYARYNTKQNILKDFHTLQKIWTHPQVLHNFQMKVREETTAKIKVEKLEDDLAREDLAASEDVKPTQTEVWWLQYLEGGNMLESLDSSFKFLAVFQILEECVALGDKVLIFSTSLYTMDSLEYFLKRINNWRLGTEYYRLDGSVPAEVRQKWCREFNAENNVKTKLFLISTRAGCLGLNMTAANRVIILDTSWNPAHDIQSIFRVYRFGQKKDCFIYRLVAMGTMEQKIYERSVTKQATACRVVDEQQIDRHYNSAELTELYRFDESGACVAAGLAAGVTDVALLRVAARGGGECLHAVREHDSLLRGSREQNLPEHERAAAWLQFQQEQEHKEMENALADSRIAHMAMKRTHGQHKPNVITNIMQEVEEPKSKKKKGDTREPSPSTSRQAEDADMEEDMVKKIMDILIQHNFHNMADPGGISRLVNNVRSIMASGKKEALEGFDDLSASIAKVFLEDNKPLLPEIKVEPPDDNDVEKGTKKGNKSQKNSEHNNAVASINEQKTESSSDSRTRRRAALAAKRHLSNVADEPMNKADDKDKEWNYRQYAALRKQDLTVAATSHERVQNAADHQECENELEYTERHTVEELGQTVDIKSSDKLNKYRVEDIDVPLSVRAERTKRKRTQQKEVDSTPEISRADQVVNNTQQVTQIANSSNIKQKKKKTGPKSKTHKKDIEEYTDESRITPIDKTIDDNSFNPTDSTIEDDTIEPTDTTIVLSDDEDTRSVPDLNACESQDDVPDEENANTVTEEQVPLHKSLLTNKNFIKIVAHKYLEGNPMLDEDAAVLAAQYSTFKALKEMEATGAPITSGPIYDIAVKVLGLDVLKKLHTNVKETPNSSTAKISESTTESMTSLGKEMLTSATSKLEARTASISQQKATDVKERAMVKIRMSPRITVKAQPLPPLPEIQMNTPTATPNVVPVGMIQRAMHIPMATTTQDECILPDDDDDVIVTSSPPAADVRPPPRRNSQQLIFNTVVAKGGPPRGKIEEIEASTVTPVNPSFYTSAVPVELTPNCAIYSSAASTVFTSAAPTAYTSAVPTKLNSAVPVKLTSVVSSKLNSAVPVKVTSVVSSKLSSTESPKPTSAVPTKNTSPGPVLTIVAGKVVLANPLPPTAKILSKECLTPILASHLSKANMIPVSASNVQILNSQQQTAPVGVSTSGLTSYTTTDDTICLDSDEEDASPPPKAVAMKSTSKPPYLPAAPSHLPPAPSHLPPASPHHAPAPPQLSPAPPQVPPAPLPKPALDKPQRSIQLKMALKPQTPKNTNSSHSKNIHITKDGIKMVPLTLAGASALNLDASKKYVLVPSSSMNPPASEPSFVQSLLNSEAGKNLKAVTPGCQTGDIVRINKKGAIEVIRKTDTPGADKSKPKTFPKKLSTESIANSASVQAPMKTNQSLSNTSTIARSSTTTADSTSNFDITKTPTTSRQNSTSSDSSNSSNANDTLSSILKNVVHIKVIDEKQNKPVNKVKETNITASQSNAKNTKVLPAGPKSRGVSVIDLTDIPPSKPASGSIDLTKINNIQLLRKKTDDSSRKSNVKNQSHVVSTSNTTTASGSKKDGKLKLDYSKAKPKPPTPTLPVKVKTEVKKRIALPPATSSSTVKKKKSDNGYKPVLTLKDFTLDDIDDIIELE